MNPAERITAIRNSPQYQEALELWTEEYDTPEGFESWYFSVELCAILTADRAHQARERLTQGLLDEVRHALAASASVIPTAE